MIAMQVCERGEAASESAVISNALDILRRRVVRPASAVLRVDELGDYLHLMLAAETRRVVCVAWLNRRRQVLWCGPLFHGDVDHCSVYPREVVREALRHNATQAVLAFSEPTDPEQPDAAAVAQFAAVRDALGLLGIVVLDCLMITSSKRVSLVDEGLSCL
ncbi:JAB domain-containing protein [Rugamonas aquatica]|uniref:MPN domain-containing protein n=1 Tax=Rugamonas aquatica TaxID=2743357 RepID=A0A6A7N684_9BURK|nr:JAB domain-containing protein [Rugamonas aquatica]MQA40603.1 hypothetical protein [Rugamonas aquatica]